MTMICCPLRLWRQSFVLMMFSLLLAGSAGADPAGRVGRVAWLSGSVHLHQTARGESGTVERNWPLSSGDLLSTAAGARAEVQIGSAVLRLNSGSVLEFVQLDDQGVFLRLLDGSVIIRLPFPESAGEYELALLDSRFKVRDAGLYRFDAERRSGAATVYSGRLQRTTSDSALEIDAGQRLVFWDGGAGNHRFAAPQEDEFAAWNSERDRQSNTQLVPYVSSEMTGAADLAAYGSWAQNAEYGAVWYPRAVPVGWAPYRSGRWIWVAPWGWTWVGDEPWGFAPFHYGRWIFLHGAWGWVPGRWVARPVYAPALVAWIGTPGAGVRFGARPAVGWFPLAPREVYVPSYRASEQHFRQINGAHLTHLPPLSAVTRQPQAFAEQARYAHRASPYAVTMAHSDAFTERRHVREAVIGQRERHEILRGPVHVRPPLATPEGEATRRRLDGDWSSSAPRWSAGAERAVDEPRSERRTPLMERSQRQSPQLPNLAPLPAAPVVQTPAPATPSATAPAAIDRPADRPRHQPGAFGMPAGSPERGEQNTGRPTLPATPAPATPVRPLTVPPSERPPNDGARPWTGTREGRESRHDRRDEPRGSPMPIPSPPAAASRPLERSPADFVRPPASPRPEHPGERGDRQGHERRRPPAERPDQWDDSIRRQTH